MVELGVPAAVAQGGHEGHLRAGILGGKGQRAAESCDADVARRAWTALHHDLADQLGRKITGGVVAVRIVVAKRNPVEGHVVTAVINTADGGVLGFAEAGTVRLHVRDARGDVHDRRIVGGRDDVVGNVLQRQDGRGHAGAQLAVGRRGREGGAPGRGDFKFLEPQYRLAGWAHFVRGPGRGKRQKNRGWDGGGELEKTTEAGKGQVHPGSVSDDCYAPAAPV